MQRQNPWHLRLPQAQHYQWFKNLVDLHELTTLWIKDLQVDRPNYFLTRGLTSEMTENLWMLDSLSQTSLDELLDETDPHTLLTRLEKTIWTIQAWTLNHILSQTLPQVTSSLSSLIEQTSWKAGKSCAEKRWPKLQRLGSQDLSTILMALQDTPFSGYPHSSGFLVRRVTHESIEVELQACPHQQTFTETQPQATTLCQVHTQWCRGFGYALNQRTSIEHTVQSPRCLQRWTVI